MKRKKGFYSISVVAKMFSVHQQTIRMYEKQGLISPSRSSGNTRLFSEEDVDRLEEVINLTHKMGVNLVGVEIILKLQKKISRMQEDMNKMFNAAQGQLQDDSEELKTDMKKQVERLVQIRQTPSKAPKLSLAQPEPVAAKRKSADKEHEEAVNPEVVDSWEIDYDDK